VLPVGFSAIPVQTLDGEQVNIAALSAERPLLIYVWATWCGICRYTTPAVEKLTQEGGNVLSVALRSGDDGQLAAWMAKKQLTMPVVNDAAEPYHASGR
jgi:thiol-disulfide isomerase/thioredoxin